MRVNSSPAIGALAPKATAVAACDGLAELAQRPLFEPLRALLLALHASGRCGLDELNLLVAARHAGAPPVHGLRFVAPDSVAIAYEQRIVSRGEVVTRPGNWHDLFNALVWMRFPRTKRVLAELHASGPSAPGAGGRRGPLRDAATQFDESGIVVAASDAGLLDLLAARRWRELFWDRRGEVERHMRFLVFGHGLYDALRSPFYRMCGRAALLTVPQRRLDGPVETLCDHADGIVAGRFAGRTWYPRPKALLALPLLGIPGVCADNEHPGYYDDTVQFRPPPEP
jgi:hypothetical protein